MLTWLRKLWRLIRRRLGGTERPFDYCIECGSCGEDGCCPTEMCVGGLFCEGFYGPVRRGPVEALVTLRREANDYAALMTPRLVPLEPGEEPQQKDTIFGWPMPKGMREETWPEYRKRVAK